MTALGKLMGEEEHVHFEQLTEGSVGIALKIDDKDAQKKIEHRLESRSNAAPIPEVTAAYQHIDELLFHDLAFARLEGRNHNFSHKFIGVNRPLVVTNELRNPHIFKNISDNGSLQGKVIGVSRRNAGWWRIILLEGDIQHNKLFTYNDNTAKEIAQHLFGPIIRVSGKGTWDRHENGKWELTNFNIEEFKVLSQKSLLEVIQEIRAVPGSKWSEIEDPLQYIMNERYGE